MAEISKYQAHTVGRLFLHNNRQQDDGVQHSNTEIDNDRTYLNYNFKKGSPEDVKRRTHELYHAKRKDLVVLIEAVVTLPQDVEPEDEKKFFKACYDFYANDFGEENIVNAVVHKDETTPHIHIDFMPVKALDLDMSETMKQNIANYEKDNGVIVDAMLCAKDVITREYLQTMHPRLLDYVTKELGYECEILNGATANGNKTVLQMKMERFQAEVERKGSEVEVLEKNISSMMQKLDSLGIDRRYFDMHEVLTLMDKLQTENEVYRDIIQDYNLPLPQSAMQKISELAENLKSNLTVHTGIYQPAQTFVLETYKNMPRPLPQQKLIDEDAELKYLLKAINPKDVVVQKVQDKEVILFPTDNIEDTFHDLLRIKAMEHKLKHISFPQISNDNLHLAETVLKECSFQTDYYLAQKKQLDDMEKDIEQRMEKE